MAVVACFWAAQHCFQVPKAFSNPVLFELKEVNALQADLVAESLRSLTELALRAV